jgi:hypothetical protein
MKVFTVGRAMRLAMLGGAVYYVRKHGGLKATWNHLADKIKPFAEQAKEKVADVTQRTEKPTEPEKPSHASGGTTGLGSGVPDFGNKTGY